MKPKPKKEWSPKPYIFAGLRKTWRWHPARSKALRAAMLPGTLIKDAMYKCAACSSAYAKKDVQVDHIDPVIDPTTGFVDWNTYIRRLLYVTVEMLQVMCKCCHKQKTLSENKLRRKKK